jgi:hypothetical protein
MVCESDRLCLKNVNSEVFSQNNINLNYCSWKRINKNFLSTPISRFNFKGSPGIKVEIERNDVLGHFQLFLTDNLIEKIVLETNIFAEQEKWKATNKPVSRALSWQPITSKELWIFIRIIILQSINVRPE